MTPKQYTALGKKASVLRSKLNRFSTVFSTVLSVYSL